MPECRSWARAVNAKKRARAKCREAQTVSSNVCTADETNETPVIGNKSTGAILKKVLDGGWLAATALARGESRVSRPDRETPSPHPLFRKGRGAMKVRSNLISSRRSETVLASLEFDSLCSREDVIALAFARV